MQGAGPLVRFVLRNPLEAMGLRRGVGPLVGFVLRNPLEVMGLRRCEHRGTLTFDAI